MMQKFAKLIANNIGTIAENSARIVCIDAKIGISNPIDAACARADLAREIEKAKRNIAAILQEPGARMS